MVVPFREKAPQKARKSGLNRGELFFVSLRRRQPWECRAPATAG
jgi:hypothetical protein